jgi:hypothetical protein
LAASNKVSLRSGMPFQAGFMTVAVEQENDDPVTKKIIMNAYGYVDKSFDLEPKEAK